MLGWEQMPRILGPAQQILPAPPFQRLRPSPSSPFSCSPFPGRPALPLLSDAPRSLSLPSSATALGEGPRLVPGALQEPPRGAVSRSWGCPSGPHSPRLGHFRVKTSLTLASTTPPAPTPTLPPPPVASRPPTPSHLLTSQPHGALSPRAARSLLGEAQAARTGRGAVPRRTRSVPRGRRWRGMAARAASPHGASGFL